MSNNNSKLIQLPVITDPRGSLTFAESKQSHPIRYQTDILPI